MAEKTAKQEIIESLYAQSISNKISEIENLNLYGYAKIMETYSFDRRSKNKQ